MAFLRRALLLVVPGLFVGLGVGSCGSKDENPPEPPADTGDETADVVADGDAPPTDAPGDIGPDAPPPVSCTAKPTFVDPIKVNHNPDALRSIASASMVQLDDGRLLIVFLEAIDTGTRYGLFARTVDPSTGKADADTRLDLDADGLVAGSSLGLARVSNGAAIVIFGNGSDRRLRVYSTNKWSPEMGAAGMPIVASDGINWAGAANGTVLVTRARAGTPAAQAAVYKPDEGPASGSWSSPQTLDLDGASGTPTVSPYALPDGRYYTLVWHGAGGPSVRIRNPSGSWSTPGAKAEIGPLGTSPTVQLLEDGSLVMVALEASASDTYKAVTSTWTAADGWSSGRLLSKLPSSGGETNGVIPAGMGPFFFRVDGKTLEFVAWVAACTTVAKDCDFHAISRRYTAGAWKPLKDSDDLQVGAGFTGSAGLSVVALDGQTPLVARRSTDGSKYEVRMRIGDADYSPLPTTGLGMYGEDLLFGSTVKTDALFYGRGGKGGVWALASRTQTSGTTTAIPSAASRINPAATKWNEIKDGTAEMRSLSNAGAYVDGAGGFTVAVNNATTDGTDTIPILMHLADDLTPESKRVLASDEKAGTFANVPKGLYRPGRDLGAIFTVLTTPSDTTAKGKRLWAYVLSGYKPASGPEPLTAKILAADTRAPRPMDMLVFGCGGAILYAVDPVDGSHALELVLVK